MISTLLRGWKILGRALLDPVGAVREVGAAVGLLGVALTALSSQLVLGASTLPRQLRVLERALGPTGDAAQDAHYSLIEPGLTRIMIADRLVPSPTLLVAACAVVILAEPMLALARDRRSALWTVSLLGLAPLLVQAAGETLLAYLASFAGRPAPGMAISIANEFGSGPLLLWRGEASPPSWLVLLDSRLNLISLWCVTLWIAGLKELDGGRLRAWHVGIPVVSLVVGGVGTWVLGPIVFSAILGRP